MSVQDRRNILSLLSPPPGNGNSFHENVNEITLIILVGASEFIVFQKEWQVPRKKKNGPS